MDEDANLGLSSLKIASGGSGGGDSGVHGSAPPHTSDLFCLPEEDGWESIAACTVPSNPLYFDSDDVAPAPAPAPAPASGSSSLLPFSFHKHKAAQPASGKGAFAFMSSFSMPSLRSNSNNTASTSPTPSFSFLPPPSSSTQQQPHHPESSVFSSAVASTTSIPFAITHASVAPTAPDSPAPAPAPAHQASQGAGAGAPLEACRPKRESQRPTAKLNILAAAARPGNGAESGNDFPVSAPPLLDARAKADSFDSTRSVLSYQAAVDDTYNASSSAVDSPIFHPYSAATPHIQDPSHFDRIQPDHPDAMSPEDKLFLSSYDDKRVISSQVLPKPRLSIDTSAAARHTSDSSPSLASPTVLTQRRSSTSDVDGFIMLTGTKPFRVLTYNVNWGYCRMGIASPKVEKILQAIIEAAADVVCLQETHNGWEHFLRASLGSMYPHILFRHHDTVLPESQMSSYAGGQAFFSLHPLTDVWYEQPNVPGSFFPGWMVRVLIHGKFPVNIVNVHLRPPLSEVHKPSLRALFQTSSVRKSEVQYLFHRMSMEPWCPLIFAGDFNEGHDGAAINWLKAPAGKLPLHDALFEFQEDVKTWKWPLKFGLHLKGAYDHILYSPDSVRALSCRVMTEYELLSDHMPVVAEFVLLSSKLGSTKGSRPPKQAPLPAVDGLPASPRPRSLSVSLSDPASPVSSSPPRGFATHLDDA